MSAFHLVLGIISVVLIIDGSFILSTKGKDMINSMKAPLQVGKYLNSLGKILFKGGLLTFLWVSADYFFFSVKSQNLSLIVLLCLFALVIVWEYSRLKKSSS